MKNIFRKIGLFLFCCFLLILLGFAIFNSNGLLGFLEVEPLSSQELQLDEQTATIRAIQRNKPAVVNITVYVTQKTERTDRETGARLESEIEIQDGAGTGFLISSDGYILTNKHVVESSYEGDVQFRVVLSSGKKYYGQLIDTDPLNDLAVLRIHDRDLPYVELGDSDQLMVGSSVIAIGNALGRYQDTVTKGIISGSGRDFMASGLGGGSQLLNNVLQTDAGINLGNSGGPLIDLNGKVVGVNVATDRTGDSIGFAIPINEVRPVIQSIEEYGRIIRPRLGVSYQMLTPELAADKGVSRNSGALIVSDKDHDSGVLPGSSAQEAGLGVGDVIFEINAIQIDENNDLRSVIQKYRPGDRIGLKVQRDDRIFIREVVLERFN